MTKKEIVNRNIGLTFDLIQKIIDNPVLADKIPDNSVIEFVEKDFEVRKKGYAKNSKLIKVKNEIEIP
jgi:beta-xylosidase